VADAEAEVAGTRVVGPRDQPTRRGTRSSADTSGAGRPDMFLWQSTEARKGDHMHCMRTHLRLD